MRQFLAGLLVHSPVVRPRSPHKTGRRGRSPSSCRSLPGRRRTAWRASSPRACSRGSSQPFVVENRAGASGNTGTAAVAKAAPDGHTLGVSIVGPLVINHLLFAKMPYDTAKDIAPITILAAQPSVLAIAPERRGRQRRRACSPLIKREPDKFTYGSIGRGSLSHLAMASLAMKAGVTAGASAVCGLAGGGHGAAARRRADGGAAGRPPWRRRRAAGQAEVAGRDLRRSARRCCPICRPCGRRALPASKPTPGSA